LLRAAPAAAKSEEKALAERLAQYAVKVDRLKAEIQELEANYAREIDERDRLMLRKRFVEGREFFYELHDYRGAVEVFYGIVNHPLAGTLPNLNEAMFYLAEALFHVKSYSEAKAQYEKILQKGPSDFYPMSLMRLIEIAVVQRNYGEAERLYATLLTQFKEGEDGSLGRYIIGKSYYLRGDPAKALEILDSVPENGSYYATAQYYAAVLMVKQGNYREAVNRLRQLKKTLKGDVANKDELYSLTNLSLARIYYELNDFPQAMAHYTAVPENAPGCSDALYESIWVYITRNDYLLKAVDDERGVYEGILFDFAEFRDAVDAQEDQESLKGVSEQSNQLEGDLDQMKTMFNEIDAGLVHLQQDAINSFNKLVQAAPNSPVVPEAEILAGNIFAQAEDFKKAEEWFVRLKKKYEDFYATVAAVRPRLQPSDYVNMIASASASTTDGAPMAPSAAKGLPPEAAYWLAADKDVRRLFGLYESVSKERESIIKMRELAADVSRRLAALERGKEYPILREAHRLDMQSGADIQALQIEGLSLRRDAEALPSDSSVRQEVAAKTGSAEAAFPDWQNRLTALSGKIDQKKKERLAFFRRELATLRAPLDDYDRAVGGLLARAGNELATVAASEMADIERSAAEYAQKADLGIIDVAWRATRGSSREIKKMQQDMEKELREFKRLQRGAETPKAPAAGEEAAPEAPSTPSETPPTEPPPPPSETPPAGGSEPAPTGGGSGQ
jgi:tetratricopeptide (TPR) repeat protein